MAIKNVLIQLFWIGIALVIGICLSKAIFEATLWRSIFSGIFTLLAYFMMSVISNWIKAMKDPDVQVASDLRMSIKRYRHYQRLYDEYHEFMLKHGIDSHASEEKFKEIFKQIDNPNEWRRYQQYRQRSSSISEMYKSWKREKDI